MKTIRLTVALLALALFAGLADEADAACGSGNRMDYRDSECLHAWWDNNWWPDHSKFGVQSFCFVPTAGGKVVAKIDIQRGADRTWHLNHGNKRRGTTRLAVRNVYCCEDLSDLCEWNDRVNQETCLEEWNEGTGQDRCTNVTITPRKPKRWTCKVTADCESEDGNQTVETTVSIRPFDDDNDVTVCPNGTVRYWIGCRRGD